MVNIIKSFSIFIKGNYTVKYNQRDVTVILIVRDFDIKLVANERFISNNVINICNKGLLSSLKLTRRRRRSSISLIFHSRFLVLGILKLPYPSQILTDFNNVGLI